MSRRNNLEDHHLLSTMVQIECAKGHRVGSAVKHRLGHPAAGQYRIGNGMHFESEDGTQTGWTREAGITASAGRLRGECREEVTDSDGESGHPCGSDVIVRWETVKRRLDDNDTRGVTSTKVRPER